MQESLPGSKIGNNVPEMGVSELAFSLKKTLEETYGRVRVRGELSRVHVHGSGHMYSSLKDDQAVIDLVCWRSTLARLSIRPEEGLEVICTGKITTYPARSNYQLVVEQMELAGEGALLKLLEDRKKRLAAEGLFDPSRKRKLPFLPRTIGVVTSPSGAVIRDILHRLSDRFPCHVLVWPVAVQGEGAAEQVAAAIDGFNALPADFPRPDLLIVARGGGSLEDLMPFNAEDVVRAAAKSQIPLISAVGHETDTTLIDLAADLRAPTPTGAAEMAVPVRLNLIAQVQDDTDRLQGAMIRLVSECRKTLDHLQARLGDPSRILDVQTQKIDYLSSALGNVYQRFLDRSERSLVGLSGRLRHPKSLLEEAARMLSYHGQNLTRIGPRLPDDPARKLDHAARMLETLSFERVLERGYTVVRDDTGNVISDAGQLTDQQPVRIQFRGKRNVGARITDEKL